MYTRLCDVGRRTTNATPLSDLVEVQLGMLVDSNCDDPQAHRAAQGDAVGDVGRLRLQYLLGEASRCEGAHSRTSILHATGTRVPDTALCGAVGNSTMGDSKARDPSVEEPRGWIALRAGCHSLREGMCCEERSSVTVSAPRPLKRCVTVRRTQTQLSTRTVTLPATHHKHSAA